MFESRNKQIIQLSQATKQRLIFAASLRANSKTRCLCECYIQGHAIMHSVITDAISGLKFADKQIMSLHFLEPRP